MKEMVENFESVMNAIDPERSFEKVGHPGSCFLSLAVLLWNESKKRVFIMGKVAPWSE